MNQEILTVLIALNDSYFSAVTNVASAIKVS